ncbi:DoxX family protein [Glaciecola petra]|uniref:DoxX family protein n=1 Tax=Glaciecola petra TaxID=3075602 RepID=A0ABU2ZX21_9ALTE|nr:DoxX family protein [Aestuariibacter sp. P117]MDT0595972.1 DoxX family protein [Aestuariibacter sp. P117]
MAYQSNNGGLENISILIGRVLLGLYFLLPGIQKVLQFDTMLAYMTRHEVPFTQMLLVITLVLQIVAGLALISGFKVKVFAFSLAILTLIINFYMHNFWSLPEGGDVARETQNFVKNLGIFAGLMVLSGFGAGAISLDARSANRKNLF